MTSFDVLGIGNAIVDILSHTDEKFLEKELLAKGSMQLVDEGRAESLYQKIGSATECSGGSAANTLAGLASLGAKCAFIGKVRNDQLGAIFRHDMTSIGVEFATPSATDGPATAQCIVLVTPDGQRTMATYLGACASVAESDVDEALIAQSKILYIEGYLWDPKPAKAAIRNAIASAKLAGAKIAMTLSDTFCVERHHAEFLELLEAHVDILFANEAEVCALYQTSSLEDALKKVQGACEMVAVTCSEKGAYIVTPQEITLVPTLRVAKVVDTTGAGDLFAAGFLFGYTRGYEPQACAKLGNACAGQIIQQLGARSIEPLKALVA